MSEDEYTITARDLLGTDGIELVDVGGGGRQIVRASGMSEGDVWLQYRDDGEPRSVPAWAQLRVRPSR